MVCRLRTNGDSGSQRLGGWVCSSHGNDAEQRIHQAVPAHPLLEILFGCAIAGQLAGREERAEIDEEPARNKARNKYGKDLLKQPVGEPVNLDGSSKMHKVGRDGG